MSKIHISISGGALESVFSDNPKDEITIWDWDNICADPELDGDSLQREWEMETQYLHQIV